MSLPGTNTGAATGTGSLSGINGFYFLDGGPVALTNVAADNIAPIIAYFTASGTLNFEIDSNKPTLEPTFCLAL